ncbi:hypothetical protein Adu01nite_80020 [Paractinoplanes durhamensis]|uniref:Uncharacterized protein n=1 Tax=Paractinoplanes durhamensis TaxID=113563 RepID=A0ABQ3Z9Z5_9ACTN|nr:hypothetical protein Adu01nite_80020 [Actinoplanes durhamensis]
MRSGSFGDPDRFTGHEIHQGAGDIAGHRTTPAQKSGLHLTNDEHAKAPNILDGHGTDQRRVPGRMTPAVRLEPKGRPIATP